MLPAILVLRGSTPTSTRSAFCTGEGVTTERARKILLGKRDSHEKSDPDALA
jgi:hypothetical protein